MIPPLRSIVAGVAFCVGRTGPGRSPGFSRWSSPNPPPISHSIEVCCKLTPPPHHLSPRWSRRGVRPGWSSVSRAVARGACWVRWFVVDTKSPPSGCHLGSSQIFGQCFGSHVGVEQEVDTQLGSLGVFHRIIIRAAWRGHSRMT